MSSDDHALSILLVEDDPVHAHLARAALRASPDGCEWRLAHVETLAQACAVPETPDLILLDLTLPDARGLDTLHRLRERFTFVPVVLLTAVEDPEIEATALQAGAQDFLGKDELTGLYNRRGFLMAAEPLARLAERAGRSFVVFFADLDGLKAINDVHGHSAGDEAIRDAAWILGQTFRSADIVSRYGGDEFAILAPDAPPSTIDIVLERLGRWQCVLNDEPGRRFPVTLSMGGAGWTPTEPRTLDGLLSVADAAAYQAKRR
jgi:diguanylate cyclase (GGDEF)-like protein